MISVRQVRWGILASLGISAAMAAYALLSATETRVKRVEFATEDESWAELVAALERLERTWHPRDRDRLLAAMESRVPSYVEGLRRVLGADDHRFVAPALELVERFRIADAQEQVVRLAESGPEAHQAQAIRVADALEPWSIETLTEFLKSDRLAVQLAAIEIGARRPNAPWERIFERFDSLPGDARAQVLDALPESLSDDAVDALLRVCLGDPSSVAPLVGALGRARVDTRIERVLASCLSATEPPVVYAALDALSSKSAPLEDTEPVWRLVEDSTREEGMRDAAMRCLWRTGVRNPERVRQMAFTMPPRARYFAARCLIDAGDARAGVENLMELVGLSSSILGADGAIQLPGEGGSVQSAAVASRQALARLAQLSPGSSEREFQEWLRDLPEDWRPEVAPAAPPF